MLVALGLLAVSVGAGLALIVTRLPPESRRAGCFAYLAVVALTLVSLASPLGLEGSAYINAAIALSLGAYLAVDWMRRGDNFTEQRASVVLLSGTAYASALQDAAFGPHASGERRKMLPRSLNAVGGAEKSYSMWLLAEKVPQGDHILFIHGDHRKYGQKYRTFCPMVVLRAAASGKITLDVHVNTVDTEDHVYTAGNRPDGTSQMNLMLGHTALLTVVLSDDMRSGSRTGSARASVYINDVLVATTPATSSALLVNDGPIYLFTGFRDKPDTQKAKIKVSDFTYHNFALTRDDVTALLRRGPNTTDVTLRLMGDDGDRLRVSGPKAVDLSRPL